MAIHTVARQATILTTIQTTLQTTEITSVKLTVLIKLTTLILSISSILACSDAAQQASEFSEPAVSTVSVSQTRLASPEEFSASTTNGVITLSWSDNVTNNTNNLSYNIYWNTTGNVTTSDTLIETVSSPHVIQGLTIGETYYFIVTAQTADQQSNPSYEIFATAPLPVLKNISLEPANHAVISGNNVQYAAKGNYSDGSIIDLTTAVNWQSDDIDTTVIDDITNKGLATTIITGISNITAVDPISSISGSTVLTSQIDHGAFDPTLTCNNSGCHLLPTTHMNTSSVCDACHSLGTESLVWTPVAVSAVDHNQVNGVCFDCHDGVVAGYKQLNHFATSDNCAKCHVTTAWSPTSVVDHNEILGQCVDCHNSVNAIGKTATHIPTTDNCHACHEPYPALWSPVPISAIDHNEAPSSCFTCHNNIVASGKSATHNVTSDLCDNCHNVSNWLVP